MSTNLQRKREKYKKQFNTLCASVSKGLMKNDPTLSQSEAFKQARKLVKVDWKETRKHLPEPKQ